MTEHAALRCRQMRISTKVPKQIVRDALDPEVAGTTLRPGQQRGADYRYLAWSPRHPEFVAVFCDNRRSGDLVVHTVLWKDHGYHEDREAGPAA